MPCRPADRRWSDSSASFDIGYLNTNGSGVVGSTEPLGRRETNVAAWLEQAMATNRWIEGEAGSPGQSINELASDATRSMIPRRNSAVIACRVTLHKEGNSVISLGSLECRAGDSLSYAAVLDGVLSPNIS